MEIFKIITKQITLILSNKSESFKTNIMAKDFEVFNWGKGQIDLSSKKYKTLVEFRPTELHMKENGSITNEPAFLFILEAITEAKFVVIGQISLEMLNGGLNELGYEIKKLEK